MRQALLISIWQLSAILLLTSSPLKVSYWMGADAHFQFLQKYLTGFNPRLWLGHSKTFTDLCISHSCCVFRSIVGRWTFCLSEVLNALDWVFIKAIFLFGCIELFFNSDESLSPSPIAGGWYQHTLLLGWYSAGDEQSWFPPNMMLRIEVHQTRESCFSQSEGPYCVILQILNVFSCVYTEDRIESCHTAIKPRSMECCSDVCPFVDFSYLHIWSWSSTRVTIRFLVTTLNKVLLHQFLSLFWRPALGRVLVVSNFFH